MSETTYGIVLLTIGVVVVLVLLVILALSIEVIVWYDNKMHSRSKQKEAEQAEEDSIKVAPEVVAAMGMALHEYFEAQCAQMGISALERRRMTTWSSSGRLDIMASRQRVTSRIR